MAYPVFSGLQPDHQFDHDVRIGGKTFFDVFWQAHVGGEPVHLFALQVAVENMCETEIGVSALDQNFRHGLPYGAEAENRHVATAFVARRLSLPIVSIVLFPLVVLPL